MIRPACPSSQYPIVEDGDGSQNDVSILAPRPGISVKTIPGNTPVKQKKGGFDSLSDGK